MIKPEMGLCKVFKEVLVNIVRNFDKAISHPLYCFNFLNKLVPIILHDPTSTAFLYISWFSSKTFSNSFESVRRRVMIWGNMRSKSLF